MGTGYLRIAVTTGNQAMPVENAQVTIHGTVNGSDQTLYNLAVNENGLTNTVSFETPDRSLSLSSDAVSAPYRNVDVTVSANGYRTETVEDVPIFDEEGAVLPVSLVPCTDCEPASTIANLPTLLTSSDSRDQVATIEETNLLPENVVIPEAIVVHLGVPDDSTAPNVRVPFIDYLKNVASHEVYPTWPEKSLEANILANISLALNRVFTRWYPSKGYPFDITASPIHDQNYSYGGVIYERIGRLVDRLFNQYINFPNQRAPFFSRFCNGTAVTCNGLSQWGSVELANQGLSALEILRRYYSDDVDIAHTNYYSSSYEAYPGSPLRQGDSGENVRKMQSFLNRIRRNFPMIPRLNADGVFGAETTRAVKAFQQTFALPPDGVIGKGTWNKISQIYVSAGKLDEITAASEKAVIDPQPPAAPLKEGSTGRDVGNVQLMLNYLSSYLPSIPAVILNSTFDAATKYSVTEFQRVNGLNPDGIVGVETWNHLYGIYENMGGGHTPAETVSEAYPGRPLGIGARGGAVRLMQQYLNQIGRAYPSIPAVTEDGAFGYATRAAVIAFQHLFNLSPDGMIGPKTWESIIAAYHGESGVPAESYPGYYLRVGAQGNDVRALQTYLSIIADHYPAIPKVSIDGDFGASTENAVSAFQRQFGLNPDGVVGPETWNLIIATYNKNAFQSPSAIQSMAQFMIGKIFFGI